jgi:DNA repair photolyase
MIQAAMNAHTFELIAGIRRTREFEKKKLAQFSVNVGIKCGHDCLYCSTGALMRMHPSFKAACESPFGFGYSIVDRGIPERVARDARRMRSRGVVQICTIVDAWAPEAQAYDLGRRCLQAILSEPGWTVRILTKNAAVRRDFDLVEKFRDRVLVGLSLTGTVNKEAQLATIERNASRLPERMAVLQEAHRRGLRTYGMLCPLLPGISDDETSITELVQFCLACGTEEIFAEPVNARGPGLRLVQEALDAAGFATAAESVGNVRKRSGWSAYCTTLVNTVQQAMERASAMDKLRFLLYTSNLEDNDLLRIRQHDVGIQWLGK